jgi:single-stranded-DNA-specific exonuclease
MKWRLIEDITIENINELADRLGVEPLMAKIMLNRGFDFDSARIATVDIHEAILDANELTNAPLAAKLIADYGKDKDADIIVFGDYDCDGVTSTFVLVDVLREVVECNVSYCLPERHDGYGLNMNFCKKLVSNNRDKRTLVITVDNGISQLDEIAYLQDNGIEVVVTDHHLKAKETVPNCIIVDPFNDGEPDTYKHLSGCGVAFKVAQLIAEEFGGIDMIKYTPYVALSIMSDVMPLSTENIAFLQYGLNIINSEECPYGIQLLKQYIKKDKLTSIDLAWDIAPRVNACGRMGNTTLASKLFFVEDNIEESLLAIEKINTERKGFSDKAKKLVEKMDFTGHNACVIDATGYPEGIIGIIAGKAAEKFNMPAIVIAGDKETVSGSARSANGISLQSLLQEELEKGNVVSFGGHDAAAGVTIERIRIKELQASLDEAIGNLPQPKEIEEELLYIDEVINLDKVCESTYKVINDIPYDNKTIDAPVFAMLDIEVMSTKTSKSNPNNICFKLRDGRRIKDIWAWGMAPSYEAMGSPSRIHIAGQIERDFMNIKNFTFKVMDFMGA